MLHKDGIHAVHGFIDFKSKGKLKNKPPYFSVGGFGIPVNIEEEKDYIFNFDFAESSGRANIDENGIATIEMYLRDLDWEYIFDSLECEKDLNLFDIFRSIEHVEMDEIFYFWDKENEDGSIEENGEHFFDVSHFQLDVYYTENGEDKIEEIIIPQNLLDSYNLKTDKYWKSA